MLRVTASWSGAAAAGLTKVSKTRASAMRFIDRPLPVPAPTFPKQLEMTRSCIAECAPRLKTRAAAPSDTHAQTTTEPAGLELVRNVVEGRVELGADALHRANRRNRNQRRDQTIFNGGRALCIPKKFHQLGHLWSPIRRVQTITPLTQRRASESKL